MKGKGLRWLTIFVLMGLVLSVGILAAAEEDGDTGVKEYFDAQNEEYLDAREVIRAVASGETTIEEVYEKTDDDLFVNVKERYEAKQEAVLDYVNEHEGLALGKKLRDHLRDPEKAQEMAKVRKEAARSVAANKLDEIFDGEMPPGFDEEKPPGIPGDKNGYNDDEKDEDEKDEAPEDEEDKDHKDKEDEAPEDENGYNDDEKDEDEKDEDEKDEAPEDENGYNDDEKDEDEKDEDEEGENDEDEEE